MKLKPRKMKLSVVTQEPEEVIEKVVEKPKKKKANKLPPDEYSPLFEPTRFLVRETRSQKDATKVIKQYIEVSVKRFGEDEINAPMVYMQMYQESEFYTGYLKGKTIYFPLESLYDIIDILGETSEKCDEKHIY